MALADATTVAQARATTPARLRAELRGDLDTIALRALAKEPSRRYGSALQLAEDLGRYLAGQPVTARPDTLAYRASKFVRRHRIGVSAAAAFVLVLIVFGASMAAAQRRTARALTAAQLEREKAEEVAQFLEGLFTAANPIGGQPERLDTVRAAALLERGARRANAELAERPVIRATLLTSIGQTMVGMGRYPAADTLLRQAVQLLRDDGTDSLELADALSALGVLGLYTERPAEAEPLFREAAAIRRSVLPSEDARIPAVLGNLAASLQDQNRFDDAMGVYVDALGLVRAAPSPDSARLYVLLNGRANLAARTGQLDTAVALMREVVEIQRVRVGEQHPTFLNELANLATLLRNSGRPEEAEPIQREAAELTRQQLGPDHPRTVFVMIGLAQNVAMLGRRDEAAPLFEEAIAEARRVLGPRSSDLGRALSLYGDVLAAGGDTARAAVHAEESWQVNVAAFGPAHPVSGLTRTKYANFRCALGAHAEAVGHYQEALAVLDAASPPNDPWPTQTRIGLGQCLTRMSRFTEAEAPLLAAWSSANATPALRNQIPAVARRLISLYEAWGRPEAAAPYRAAVADRRLIHLDDRGPAAKSLMRRGQRSASRVR
jgi:serine/threonine-protein kinase